VSWSLGLCVSGSLMCLWVCVIFDLGLESCSGPQEGKQSGAIFVDMEEEWMGWDGMWRDLEGQDVASRPFYCMPLYVPIITLLVLILVLENVLFVL
jgi:hypothetical protein